MAKFCLAAALVFITAFQGIAAPQRASQKMNHPFRAEGGVLPLRSAAALNAFPDTLKILAVMVQFQPDSDPLTTGNGQFDLSTAPQRIIDAPPRDSSYFADHLMFARNYFPKASNGKQNISATVLGAVLTLSKQMKQYAPLNSNLPLGEMITEAWGLADSAYPQFPFDEYDLFVIFHAGSGKDIDLQASIGYDPTPYDIPSLYFSLDGLKNIFGSTYTGVQLKNHPAFSITNSIVLPETENRMLPASTGGDFLYQLSINGLVVANIASHLGLPDLFDTKTGGTAIGRFGLMDGQAIFSFSGLFPPEPCAWEKIYLGWTSPSTVASGAATLRTPAVGLYHGRLQAGEDTIYRIPISAKEYFLIENRNRDAHNDGDTLTIRWNGQQFTKYYKQDDNDFNAFNVDSIYGTVVDVDEFDWSLPGSDFPGQPVYMGGILIWHIDETVIENNLATNTINADPTHRGVNLEEADGSQDIGQTYGLLDAGSGSEDGSPIDYWFKGNISPVYTNEFSETSHPNSLSNSRARSHITLNNFSNSGLQMTFQASVGDANVSLQKIIKRKDIKLNRNDSPLFADIDGNGSDELIYTSGDSIYVLKNDLTPYLNNTTGLFSPFGGKSQPSLAPLSGLACSRDSIFMILGSAQPSTDNLAAILGGFTAGAPISTPPSARIVSNTVHYYMGDQNGNFYDFSGSNTLVQHRLAFSPITSLSVTPVPSWTATSNDSLFIQNSSALLNGKNIVAFGSVRIAASSPANSDVVVCDDNTFSVFNDELTKPSEYHVNGNVTGSLAIADVNGDGQEDILIGTDNGLYAYNWNGSLLENFPLKVLDGGKITGSPIVVGLAGSTTVGIIFASSNGQVYGYDGNGKALNGFPLQTGGVVSSLAFSGSLLAAASTDSSIYVWRVEGVFDSSKIFWKGFLADEYHTNYVASTAVIVPKSTELLPSALAYNWPNPVYDKVTNIRYYLNKPATVDIKIYNVAGELVDHFSGPGVANIDNEVQWNVSKVQSGVYFAQIRANAAGEQKSVVVKIAVVK
jgi:Secretion system C-terminal sorting domain/FG-GAP repeat